MNSAECLAKALECEGLGWAANDDDGREQFHVMAAQWRDAAKDLVRQERECEDDRSGPISATDWGLKAV